MSTINNNSPSFRQRSNLSYTSSNSRTSSKSSTHTPSPRKIITSRPPKPELEVPITREEVVIPEQQSTWQTKLDGLKVSWNRLIEILFSPSAWQRVRNGLLILGLGLILISMITRGGTPHIKSAPREFKTATSLESKGAEVYENVKSVVPEWERVEDPWDDRHIGRIFVEELKSPIHHLIDLNTVYYLEPLQVAYSDIRYTLNELKEDLIDMASDTPTISSRLRHFRDHAWKFSEAIGEYRKFTYAVLGKLSQRSQNLKKGLIRVKPVVRWKESYQPNSKTGKKIAHLWLTYYEELKKEVQSAYDETNKFQLAIAEASQERTDLDHELKLLQPGMTKEAKTREWDNFDFEKVEKLLLRLSGKNDDDPNSYEYLLSHRAKDVQKALLVASGQVLDVIDKLQRSIKEGEGVSKETDEPRLTEVPTLDEQIEVLDEAIQRCKKTIAWVDTEKDKLDKRLKEKAHGSAEKILAYDHGLFG